MIDPADQRASDEAIKRNTNLTPTEVRQSLNATAIDFQRRIDARASIAPTASTPQAPAEITSRETRLDAQGIVLPTTTEVQSQNPFPSPQNPPAPIGTASNPYPMGTNSTTSGNPALAQDDFWTPDGPSPAGGGPWDGVLISTFTRFYQATPGMDPILKFDRPVEADSTGKIILIGPESGALAGFTLA